MHQRHHAANNLDTRFVDTLQASRHVLDSVVAKNKKFQPTVAQMNAAPPFMTHPDLPLPHGTHEYGLHGQDSDRATPTATAVVMERRRRRLEAHDQRQGIASIEDQMSQFGLDHAAHFDPFCARLYPMNASADRRYSEKNVAAGSTTPHMPQQPKQRTYPTKVGRLAAQDALPGRSFAADTAAEPGAAPLWHAYLAKENAQVPGSGHAQGSDGPSMTQSIAPPSSGQSTELMLPSLNTSHPQHPSTYSYLHSGNPRQSQHQGQQAHGQGGHGYGPGYQAPALRAHLEASQKKPSSGQSTELMLSSLNTSHPEHPQHPSALSYLHSGDPQQSQHQDQQTHGQGGHGYGPGYQAPALRAHLEASQKKSHTNGHSGYEYSPDYQAPDMNKYEAFVRGIAPWPGAPFQGPRELLGEAPEGAQGVPAGPCLWQDSTVGRAEHRDARWVQHQMAGLQRELEGMSQTYEEQQGRQGSAYGYRGGVAPPPMLVAPHPMLVAPHTMGAPYAIEEVGGSKALSPKLETAAHLLDGGGADGLSAFLQEHPEEATRIQIEMP